MYLTQFVLANANSISVPACHKYYCLDDCKNVIGFKVDLEKILIYRWCGLWQLGGSNIDFWKLLMKSRLLGKDIFKLSFEVVLKSLLYNCLGKCKSSCVCGWKEMKKYNPEGLLLWKLTWEANKEECY